MDKPGNQEPKGIRELIPKATPESYFLLSKKHLLMERFTDLLRMMRENKLSEEKIGEILKLISHI